MCSIEHWCTIYTYYDECTCVALSTGSLYTMMSVRIMKLCIAFIIAFITAVRIKIIYSNSSIVVNCVGYVIQNYNAISTNTTYMYGAGSSG